MKNIPELLQQNIDLQKIVADKDDIICAQEKSLNAKEKRIRILEEYILSLQQKQFGSSSEKQEVIQAELVFTEAEDNAEAEAPEQVDAFSVEPVIVAEHQRKKKRISIPKELPRVDIIHDLPEDQKHCPHDGAELKSIGFESHEQLDIIPASVRVLHHKRLKYACPCCEKHIVIASKPAQPIEKSIASPGLLAHIAIQKYADALPLYRHDCMDAGGRATQEQLPRVKSLNASVLSWIPPRLPTG